MKVLLVLREYIYNGLSEAQQNNLPTNMVKPPALPARLATLFKAGCGNQNPVNTLETMLQIMQVVEDSNGTVRSMSSREIVFEDSLGNFIGGWWVIKSPGFSRSAASVLQEQNLEPEATS